MGSRTLHLAQLTDTHVADPASDDELYVDNNGRAFQAVDQIAAEIPSIDAVLATGDLTNWGRPVEYELLAGILSPLPMPVLALPGNHDDRDLLRATFPDLPWVDAEHASWVVELGDVRIIGLDSTIPGEPGACFDDDREAWLRAVMAQPHAGTSLLALHHPPFRTGIEWMDRAGFIGLDRLEALLTEHPVERVFSGHLHRPVTSSIAGIPAQVTLSTVQHVDLDLAPDGPVSLILDPVGYQIHRISTDGIASHTRYIDGGGDGFQPSWGRG